MKPRNQFTFYRSYFEALEDLSQRRQLKVYRAVCAYALDGKEPEDLDQIQTIIFHLIRPTLVKGRENASQHIEHMCIGTDISMNHPCDRPGAGPAQSSDGAAAGPAQARQAQPPKNPPMTGKMTPATSDASIEKEKEIEIEVDTETETEHGADAPQVGASGAGVWRKDSSCSSVTQAYCSRIDPHPTPSCLRELESFRQKLPEDRILSAIDTAVRNGRRTWPYVRGILRNFVREQPASTPEVSEIGKAAIRRLLEEAEQEEGDVT